MIPKNNEKQEAILLRRKGLSYREILEKIPVAKSTLSLWLRKVGLSKVQKQRLTQKRLAASLRGAHVRREQRLETTRKIITEASSEIGLLSERERWILGIGLYWAEGSKEKIYANARSLTFSNSDSLMVKYFTKWITKTFSVKKSILQYSLYIHEKADWKRARKWWAEFLKLSPEDIKVYFKRHNPKPHRKNTGNMYNGLIRIRMPKSGNLNRKVTGWIKGICK